MEPPSKQCSPQDAPNVTVSLGIDTGRGLIIRYRYRPGTYLVDKAPFMKILREISVFLNVKNKHVSPKKWACF